ncbi:MAG: hypothetical protein LBI62_07655 [Candidatus Accumulibacter sp.]|nr:hypothetical protein [Accumulibacter sp.]
MGNRGERRFYQGSGIRDQKFMRRFAPWKEVKPRAPTFPRPPRRAVTFSDT